MCVRGKEKKYRRCFSFESNFSVFPDGMGNTGKLRMVDPHFLGCGTDSTLKFRYSGFSQNIIILKLCAHIRVAS